MKSKRIIILGLILLLVGNLLFANLEDEIKENEAAREALREQLKGINEQKAELNAAQSQLEQEIQTINSEIQTLDTNIAELSQQISNTENSIAVKLQELEEAKEEEAKQNERMKKRLRTMYKAGSFSYLEILLGADDFSEMLTQVDKIQLLLNYDEETLQNLIEIREFIAATEKRLEESRDQLVAMKEEKTAQRTELEAKHAQLAQKQAELKSEEQALINIEMQAAQDADALTAILKEQYAQKKALEFAAQYQGGVMMWPVPAGYSTISSDFGMRVHPILQKRWLHTGIDIPAPTGTSIYAAAAGRVIHSGWIRGYGYAIMIDHGGGIISLYGHCSSLIASFDQVVSRGDVIAKVGSTGWSTGPHVHFEVRKNGDYVDPKPYLRN